MKKLKSVFCYFSYLSILFLLMNLQSAGKKNSKNQDPEKVFRAGAATAIITPPIGENAFTYWYSEKQDFFIGGGCLTEKRVAKHVHDDFHARCLILDDSETKLVFVVIDNVVACRKLYDEAKRLIKKETEIPVGNIIMSVTHTHSVGSGRADGFPFNKYQKFLIRRLADVVRLANNNLEPAYIGWGVGSVPEHLFVRRWKMKPGTPVPNPFGGQDQVLMNPGVGNPNLLAPASEPDPEVSFISVKSYDGRPIALFGNYSLHYVGGVPAEHISADYFALFADRIQELLKADRQDPPFVGIMSNGTSADVSSINYGGQPKNNSPYAKMRIVAEDVAREVFRVHNTIRFHKWVPLGVSQTELILKIRKPDRDMITRAENILKGPDRRIGPHGSEKFYNERILKMVEWPENVNIILQTFRIGDLGVATIPFEIFAETGKEIKKKSPFSPSFTIELANGWYGYLPTPEQHELGGYETWLSINRVEKEASSKIVAKLLDMFASIKEN